MLLGVDGISDFDGLHSRQHNAEVQFYAFDVLVANGEDLRPLPLHLRKNNLARMLARRVDGIMLADFEQGEIGPDLFRHALDVVTLVCLNELQDANGGGHAELADVLAALEERVRYHSRTHLPVA